MGTEIGPATAGVTGTTELPRSNNDDPLPDGTDMPAAWQTNSAGLRESPLGLDLQDDACSFEFFQAVALLQRHDGRTAARRPLLSPEDEAVHFHVNPRFGFPASEIQDLELPEDAPAEMMVNFMGLTGPAGRAAVRLQRTDSRTGCAPKTTAWPHSSTSSTVAPSRFSIARGKEPASR